MRVVIQRCKQAEVRVNGDIVGRIAQGLMLLVGVTHEDTVEDAAYLAEKVANLRIFEDEQGKMNLSVLDTGGSILSVSQFTLYGDCRKGRRPNFMAAARPEAAEQLYDTFNQLLREQGLQVQTGRFGEMMDVDFVNWGPRYTYCGQPLGSAKRQHMVAGFIYAGDGNNKGYNIN